jgi:hypothetical protein
LLDVAGVGEESDQQGGIDVQLSDDGGQGGRPPCNSGEQQHEGRSQAQNVGTKEKGWQLGHWWLTGGS